MHTPTIPDDPKREYPNEQEECFMRHAYRTFFNDYDQLMNSRDDCSARERFALLGRTLRIYTECLEYKPIRVDLDQMQHLHSMSDAIAYGHHELIRHLLVNFSFFDTWNDVSFDRSLITWSKRHEDVDRFLRRHDIGCSHYWFGTNSKHQQDAHIVFHCPAGYIQGRTVYLKDLVGEADGIDLSLRLMRNTLERQLASS